MKRAITGCLALLASSLAPVDLPGFMAGAALPPPNIELCSRWNAIQSQSWYHNGFHLGAPFILTPSQGVTTTYSVPIGDEFGVYVVATMDPLIVQRCPVLNGEHKVIGKDVDIRITIEQFYICRPPLILEHLTATTIAAALGYTQADCDPFVFVDQGGGSSWHHR